MASGGGGFPATRGDGGAAAAGPSPAGPAGDSPAAGRPPAPGGRVMRAQRGLALIGVLWIMATAVTLLTWTLSRHWMAIQRSAALLESRQAHYYALAGESYARQLLAADRLRGQIDHRGEARAQPLTAMEIEHRTQRAHNDEPTGRRTND